MDREPIGSPTPAGSRRADVAWLVVGVALFGVLAWVAGVYIGWLVFGVFTYYVARPITRRVRGRIASPSLAAGLTLVFIIGPIVLFLAAFLSVALGQAVSLLSSETATAVLDDLPFETTRLPDDPVEIVGSVLADPTFSVALEQFGIALGAFAATLFNVFLALIFAFFLLVEDGRLVGWFERNAFGSESLTMEYLRAVDRGLTSVYFGYTLTIFAIMVLTAIIYGVFNLLAPGDITIPTVMLLAIVTGLFTLIPLVGRSVVYAFIVALLSVQALDVNPSLLWVPLAFFVLMVLVFDNVVRTYIRPYLSGKTYDMPLVMFAYLLGPVLFGWYGIFMGPLLMVFIVEFIVHVLPRYANVEAGQGPVVREGPTEPEPGSEGTEADSDTDTGVSPS